MTFEEKIRDLLIAHGMWERQAQAVVDRAKEAESNEAMGGRWSDQVEDYPSSVLAVLWLSVRMEALAYIDEVCPKAFFRPMFVEGHAK